MDSRSVDEIPQEVGRYQFSHALIQETLAAELSTTRRARLYARIAQALEQLYGDAADQHAGELALHFSEAEAVTGSEPVWRYSLLAGQQFNERQDFEGAVASFQRASETYDDLIRAEIAGGLGFAYGFLNNEASLCRNLSIHSDCSFEQGKEKRRSGSRVCHSLTTGKNE